MRYSESYNYSIKKIIKYFTKEEIMENKSLKYVFLVIVISLAISSLNTSKASVKESQKSIVFKEFR